MLSAAKQPCAPRRTLAARRSLERKDELIDKIPTQGYAGIHPALRFSRHRCRADLLIGRQAHPDFIDIAHHRQPGAAPGTDGS